MLMSHKQKVYHRPPPALEFDKFLRIRSEKQSIIQSQYEPITQKVQGFQELLKLTKTGATISTQHMPKRHFNSQLLKTKLESSKTINVMNGGTSPLVLTENQPNRYIEDFQSDEVQLKKLNKMVFGLSEWEQDRGKGSFHGDKKPSFPKTSYQKKRITQVNNRNQRTSHQELRQRKNEGYGSCEGKKFKQFYAPLKKQQAMNQLNQINSQFIRTSPKVNYPPALLNCNFLDSNSNHFKQLKNKIKILQTKAINQYGLKFQQPHPHQIPRKHIWDDLKDNSQEKENEELSFSDLELAPILAKEFPNRYKSYNQTMAEREFQENDASIPKSLIDIVQLRSESMHKQFSLKNNHFSNPLKKGKMKKGYLYRPKTFKPTYTYIQI